MMRLLVVVVPVSLTLCACSSTPSKGWVGAESFELEPLRVSAVEAPPSNPGGGPGGDFLEPTRSAPAPQDDTFSAMNDRHVTVLFGERMLDEDDWDPVEDQLAVGLEFDASDPNSGHGYEVGLTYSQDDDDVGPTDVEGSIFDVYAGYRYTFPLESKEVHPYLSAGLALVRADVETDGPGPDIDEDDLSPGLYLRGGIGFDLQEDLRLGVDYRHMFFTDTDIGPIDDADYDMIMVTLGFRLTNT
jgi:hypothetical protein